MAIKETLKSTTVGMGCLIGLFAVLGISDEAQHGKQDPYECVGDERWLLAKPSLYINNLADLRLQIPAKSSNL